MSEAVDSQMEDEMETLVDDQTLVDEDSLPADEPIAPRPRGRLLRPLPLVLIAVSIAAAGFLGGVMAQKGSEGSGGARAFPGGSSLPSLASVKEAGAEAGSGESGSTGLPSFGGSSTAAATGTVTAVEGHTIYVKESDGTVVAVKAGDGATVTRDSNIAAKKVHPGDTVVVEGSKRGSTVKASRVAATEAGVESTGGAPTSTRSATSAGGGAESETSVESLFEE